MSEEKEQASHPAPLDGTSSNEALDPPSPRHRNVCSNPSLLSQDAHGSISPSASEAHARPRLSICPKRSSQTYTVAPEVEAPPVSALSQSKEELVEEQSQWLTDVLLQYPHFLALRERALPLAGGFSFANVVHTQTVSALASLNRHALLELISQHLQSIGMYRTAEILSMESGHSFQGSGSQPWDRTDLHLLTSLAVGHREDAWNLPVDANHKYVDEVFEEDFLASPYREDPSTLMEEFYNPDLNVVYDDEKCHNLRHITACSLKRFVVYFATRGALDTEECQMFFLSMHSITSASHFLEHLVTLYDMPIDPERSPDKESAGRIQMNIVNFITKWKDCHIGKRTLKLVHQFLERKMKENKDQGGLKWVEAALKKIQEVEPPTGTRGGTGEEKKVPDPIIPDDKRNILFKLSLGILDPEPGEVARQITLIYHEKYASVHSLEFIVGISKRRTTIQTPTLTEFFEFGNSLIYMMAEAFLNATNRAEAYKRILAVVKELAALSNIDGVACILSFLRRADVKSIARIPPEEMAQIDQEIATLWEKAGETETPTIYEAFVDDQFRHWKPMIPNMHVELQRGTPTGQEPDYINGLINWGKIRPLAERCVVLNRFQTESCRHEFVAITQIQKVILRGAEMSQTMIEEKLDEQARLSSKE